MSWLVNCVFFLFYFIMFCVISFIFKGGLLGVKVLVINWGFSVEFLILIERIWVKWFWGVGGGFICELYKKKLIVNFLCLYKFENYVDS